jgi:hypothetical protein
MHIDVTSIALAVFAAKSGDCDETGIIYKYYTGRLLYDSKTPKDSQVE